MSNVVSASRVIHASPATIFSVLTDPSLHPVIDGSGTVRKLRSSTPRLEMGTKFSMGMRWGSPYVISNTVVEFEPDRRIAWAHFGKHRWRYELIPEGEDTRVIESFDYSTSISPRFIQLIGAPSRNLESIEATLERLDAFVTQRRGALEP